MYCALRLCRSLPLPEKGTIGKTIDQRSRFCILYLEFMIPIIERINELIPVSTEKGFSPESFNCIMGFFSCSRKNHIQAHDPILEPLPE